MCKGFREELRFGVETKLKCRTFSELASTNIIIYTLHLDFYIQHLECCSYVQLLQDV